MSLYLLDTDTLTLFERMHPIVIGNVLRCLAEDIRITSVTVEEQLAGWFSILRSAKTPQQLEMAHVRLSATVRNLGTWDVIPFTASAETRYRDLLRRRLNVAGNDLRISAVALEAGAMVVTRNLRDFGRVPGLQCEDWSV